MAKLGDTDDDELANDIVYIDETSSFLEFTQNDTLDGVLKVVFTYLQRLVNFAGKVIVSDALINDATFLFLKRRPKSDTIMLTNTFQKFEKIPTVRVRDETEFLNKLLVQRQSAIPFRF